MLQWLAVGLACIGMLAMHGEAGPICVVVGIFPGFCWGGSWTWMNMASLMVLDWLFTSLCTMLNWLGSMGCPVVVLWRCMGEGPWNVPWLFPPGICQVHQCRSWGNLCGATGIGRWCLFDWIWHPCPLDFLKLSWGCWHLWNVPVFLFFYTKVIKSSIKQKNNFYMNVLEISMVS